MPATVSSTAVAKKDLPIYPGDDPSIPPGQGYEWRGNGPPTSGKGNWFNPTTEEMYYPDFNHDPPIESHWDYTDPSGKSFRLFPDGTVTPK